MSNCKELWIARIKHQHLQTAGKGHSLGKRDGVPQNERERQIDRKREKGGCSAILNFDPCYARATVVRARFLAAAFSDGSYLDHVNGAYLGHVKFCILFIVSPISQRGPLPTLTVPGWSKFHDGDVEGVALNKSAVKHHLRPLF